MKQIDFCEKLLYNILKQEKFRISNYEFAVRRVSKLESILADQHQIKITKFARLTPFFDNQKIKNPYVTK
jgi:hypothetical protein